MYYFVKTQQGPKGRFTKEQLRELVESGKLTSGHFVRRDGENSFSQLGILLEDVSQGTSEALPQVPQGNTTVESSPQGGPG